MRKATWRWPLLGLVAVVASMFAWSARQTMPSKHAAHAACGDARAGGTLAAAIGARSGILHLRKPDGDSVQLGHGALGPGTAVWVCRITVGSGGVVTGVEWIDRRT